jgi:hypothetical protein
LERADPLLRRNVGGNQEMRGSMRTQRKATPTWIMIQRLIVVHQPTELFDGVIAVDIS